MYPTVRGGSLLRSELGINPARARGKQDGAEGEVNSNVVVNEVSDDPTGALALGWPFRVVPPKRQGDKTLASPHGPVVGCRTPPGRVCNLGPWPTAWGGPAAAGAPGRWENEGGALT